MFSGVMFLTLALAGAPQAPATAQVDSARGSYELVKGYLLKAAAQVPEEHFVFQPTPDVRTLGALFGHVADANFMICSAASGEKPTMAGIEKSKKSKADLEAALAASFKFCDAAFDSLKGARADETVKFFLPGAHTRLGVMAFNTAHDFEHYGNIVTYMRIKGLVPPSSAPRGGAE